MQALFRDRDASIAGPRCRSTAIAQGRFASTPTRTRCVAANTSLPDQPRALDVESLGARSVGVGTQGKGGHGDARSGWLNGERVRGDDGATDVEVAASDVLPAASAGQHG